MTDGFRLFSILLDKQIIGLEWGEKGRWGIFPQFVKAVTISSDMKSDSFMEAGEGLALPCLPW